MARSAKYHVWGSVGGKQLEPNPKASLEAAAYTANKMIDQGVEEVRVTDTHGEIVSKDRLDIVWRTSAERSLIKRRRMDGR